VGVYGPTATLMFIENSDRFGLAQLHLMRGRVGRGSAKSYCVMVSEAKKGSDAEARLNMLCKSRNGYEIATFDLQLRGPGDFFPTGEEARQSGEFSFRYAGLANDASLAENAAKEAKALLESDPSLCSPKHIHLSLAIERFFKLTENVVN